jgi:cation diffusion facilitator family transporter
MTGHPSGDDAASNLQCGGSVSAREDIHAPESSASAWQSGAHLALIGLTVNIIFAVAKIAAGIFGNAYALIADGIESSLDVAGSIVIWGGLRFAARPPDATHPYGHGKAEPLAAVLVAFGVLAGAAVLAFQSAREIFLPHHAPAPYTLAVLVGVIIIKETLFRLVNRAGRSLESTAITTDAWHHRADAITSVAAFIGISLALLGGEKWRSADAYAALFACAVIATTGARLLGPALAEILDTAPRGEIIDRVQKAARAVPGVNDLDKCFVRKMGINYYVDLHVQVNGNMSVREGHEVAHRVKDAIRATDSRIADVLVHIEPA